jgi:hypothetical protein
VLRKRKATGQSSEEVPEHIREMLTRAGMEELLTSGPGGGVDFLEIMRRLKPQFDAMEAREEDEEDNELE